MKKKLQFLFDVWAGEIELKDFSQKKIGVFDILTLGISYGLNRLTHYALSSANHAKIPMIEFFVGILLFLNILSLAARTLSAMVFSAVFVVPMMIVEAVKGSPMDEKAVEKKSSVKDRYTPLPRDGGVEEDRTPDLHVANVTLSQLSYNPADDVKHSSEKRFPR